MPNNKIETNGYLIMTYNAWLFRVWLREIVLFYL
jgi:hypothetical protein